MLEPGSKADWLMPLTDQETRCIDLACDHLTELYGSIWRTTEVLDEQYQSESSPEVEVSNGSTTAAIEVKQLTLAELQQYKNWKPSLERYLAPPCPGHFVLMPCMNFKLSLAKLMMRPIRKEIARVAPTIPPEGSGAVLIPRTGYLVLENKARPGAIHCLHDPGDDLLSVSPRLDGAYFLIDGDNPWAHNFVTNETRAAWHDSILAACETPTSEGRFSWNEEWQLMRVDDGQDDERYFELLAVSDVFSGDSAIAAVWTMLEKARTKFHRRWADHHILVFDRFRNAPLITTERLASIAAEFDADDLGAVEMILFADGDDLTQVWPPQPPRPLCD